MNSEDFDTMELDEADYSQEAAEYDDSEMDAMLDAMVDSSDPAEFAERKRRRFGRKAARRRGVPTAPGRSAYREPVTGGYVSQKQFKEALDRVGTDIKRNAEGIKTINARLHALDGRVDGVVSVATTHSRAIARAEKIMKIDGALEFVEAFGGGQLNAFQLLKGAVKSGFLGEAKGAMGNPLVIGGLGLFLRNPGILGNLGGVGAGGAPVIP